MIKHTLKNGTEIEITTYDYCGTIMAKTVVNGKHMQGELRSPEQQHPQLKAAIEKATGEKGWWVFDKVTLPPAKGKELEVIIRVRQNKIDEAKKREVRIYLSSRGWGDYSACEWVGDITQPDAEILAECKDRLQNGYDVDQPNQTNEEILAKIAHARDKWQTAPARKAAAEKAEQEDIKRKIKTGYCFYCESWCNGDCGHYSNDPSIKYRRDINQAVREANYGIND